MGIVIAIEKFGISLARFPPGVGGATCRSDE
jgi:hypothetical protein